MIEKLLDGVLELIFPTDIYCISCGNLINSGKKYSLCDNCMREIKWVNENTCQKCGVYLEHKVFDICKTCLETKHRFEKAYTCMVYDDIAKNIMAQYKFQGKAYMAKALADIMIDKFLTTSCVIDMVMPVPIHRKKKKQRGYNQAGLIAKEFAKILDIKYTEDILVRKSYKVAMNELGADQRRENIIGSYTLTDDVDKLEALKGRFVLLIDDIYTTGSTVNECTSLLLSGGAKSVSVLTLAAGVGTVRSDA